MIGPAAALILAFAAALSAQPSDLAAHWPRWRGPFENGIARTAVPAEWSSEKNVAWKVEIPGRGHSTPVIWGDRIFLTTAIPTAPPAAEAQAPGAQGGRGPGGGTGVGIEHRFVVMCFDRRTGKLLWEQTAIVAKPHEGYHFRYGSFASNSPVTDGRHVYAFFGSRGLYSYDVNGKLIWKKEFAPMKMHLGFGEGAAPTLDGDRLIVHFDNQENSHVVAFDKRDGKEIWRMAREERSSWSQPVVIEHGGRRQAVISASAKVRSYDVASGKVIWEAAGLGANVIPNPVYADGIVYVMSGYRNPNLLAIRLGKEGDLTGTDSILWTNQRGNSYTPSPVLDGDKLYFVSDNGMLSCFNAKTGEPFYHQQRLPKTYNFKASPIAAGGKLYLATEEGDVVVVKMGETYEVVATNRIGDDVFISSPVAAEGTLYLRSQKMLYAIREGTGGSGASR